MLGLNSKKLRLIRLNEEHFKLLFQDFRKLEKRMDAFPSKQEPTNEYLEAMEVSLNEGIRDFENFQWYAPWQIIDKKENQIIGSIGFKGSPNEKGEVEIGYGINEEFQGLGLATEAVSVLSRWAFRQGTVNTIFAETKKNDLASTRVLEKNNFKHVGKKENSIYWQLNR
ncbi:MAG: GNAT family N-acetyltransferase [Streptococcaceae bacterium]|nr:GNAT family N-acetyltransferase [Streptococcaceae bacterium]